MAAWSRRESDIQVTLDAAKQTGSDAAVWSAMGAGLGITTVKLAKIRPHVPFEEDRSLASGYIL